MTDRVPTLVSVGGLPATGKTTVARVVAARIGAAYVRIDTIEAAVGRAEGRFGTSNDWEGPPGYLVGYAVAADQLRVGCDAVVESVNALRVTRDAWAAVARDSGARLLDVEVVCSDAAEHRRRAEGRELDVPGLDGPSWADVLARPYEPWHRDRLVVDTALLTVEEAAEQVVADVRA